MWFGLRKVITSIAITQEQKDWVDRNAINLSLWVRLKLDETIKKKR